AWQLEYQVGGRKGTIAYEVLPDDNANFVFTDVDGKVTTESYARRGERGAGGGRPPRQRGEAAKAGFALASTAIGATGMLDAAYTCDGASTSPPFSWSGVPAGTKSLALTIHHITPDDEERVYLVLSGIPAETKALEAAQKSVGTFGANGVNRRAEYAPPCSQGPGEKVYIATLYALSAEPKVAAGATRATLLTAMKDITVGTATLELRYARPDGAQGAPGGERRPREGEGGAQGGGRRGQRGGQGGGQGGGPGEGQGGAGQRQRPEGGQGGGRGEAGGDEGGLIARMTAFKTEVPATDFEAILAQPTTTSITVSVRASTDRLGAIEFAREGSAKSETTPKATMKAGTPTNFALTGLAANTGYTYRFVSWAKDGDEPKRGDERRFHTPRASGAPFTFVIQADSHLDQGVAPKVYEQTLANMVAATPDFLVDLGDTFMTDKRGQDYQRSEPQYDAQRYYFGLACHSMPLLMVLGNHDGEKGDVGRGIAEWSYNERVSRFPAPAIDGAFFTGATAMKDGKGSNYYAFEWGDALVVVLDPFWPTTERARGGGGGGGGDGPRGGGAGGGPNVEKLEPTDASWARTLGRPQYDWLAETLAKSTATQKFVFIHHLVGGIGGQAARGGVESARYFEWGGDNADGSSGFAQRRAGWPMPIHDLLVKNGVTAVFHGHDHL
ncbi:MAG: metallophosphoesterase, partial [Planctomycetota bacterium]